MVVKHKSCLKQCGLPPKRLFLTANNHNFPLRKENCNGKLWFLSPNEGRAQAQGAQYNEFLESGLKNRLPCIGQRLQYWTKDNKKAKTNKRKKIFCKEIPPRQSPRRVVLKYIPPRPDYSFQFLMLQCSLPRIPNPLSLEGLPHYIAPFR